MSVSLALSWLLCSLSSGHTRHRVQSLNGLFFCPPNFEYLQTHRLQDIGKQNNGDVQLVFSFDEEVKINNNNNNNKTNNKQGKPGS